MQGRDPSPKPANGALQDVALYPAPDGDRRGASRVQTIYRPCCVIRDNAIGLGLVRNFSEGGALIEIDPVLNIGDEIRYFWDSSVQIAGRIVWREGKSHGLQHIETFAAPPASHPARSVRIPCQAEAVCWMGDEVHTVLVENISIGGASLRGLPTLPIGHLLTLSFCGMELGSCTVRWSEGARTGISFGARLSQLSLAQLLTDERFELAELQFMVDDE